MFCPNAVDWGNLATWVAGIATVLTLWFGIYQWATLRRDALNERSLKLQYEKIAQARRIFAWLLLDPRSGHARGIGIGNSSAEPVYAVVVHYVYMDGHHPGSGEETEWRIRQTMHEGPPEIRKAIQEAAVPPIQQFRAVVQTLPPGNYWVVKPQQMDNPGLEIAFTDGAGLHWVRRVTGELAERDTGAVDFHNIEPPVKYDLLNTYAGSI